MEVSEEIRELVQRIDDFSSHKLTNRDMIATLIELARTNDQREGIGEIAFLSKFLSNTYGILKRSTPETEGYEKLAKEFQENLEKVVSELKDVLQSAPSDVREAFSSKYLAMTSESFQILLTLLYDFSWVKNWYIDHEARV